MNNIIRRGKYRVVDAMQLYRKHLPDKQQSAVFSCTAFSVQPILTMSIDMLSVLSLTLYGIVRAEGGGSFAMRRRKGKKR